MTIRTLNTALCASLTSSWRFSSSTRESDSTGAAAPASALATAASRFVSEVDRTGAFRSSYWISLSDCLRRRYCAGENSTTFSLTSREQASTPSLNEKSRW